MLSTDRELIEKDILGLSSAEAVVGFLASLGYRTEARTVQASVNLGITAESLIHQIRRLELLADHEGLLQVYLVELTSVTVAATRALARAFRTLNVQFPLLILTHDYERLDFVLVEKVLPASGDDGGPMGQKQVAVRPRILTVDRRDPGRVDLRVLRRFTYTEADPIAQGEKLLSAYGVADWSEEFFNNRALFSDYFLLERVRDDPVWHEDPKPVFRAFRDLYANARSQWAGKSELEVRGGLLVPALKALGFEPRPGKAAADSRMEPDFRLCSDPGEKVPIGHCLAYPWDRHLDGKDSKDIESPEENPGQAVVSLLEQGEAQWAIVTNGKHWRLYSAKAHSRATNYYEIDLEEVLAADNKDPQDSFRYFWLLFRQAAFRPPDCFLDHLLRGSAEYAKRLGERLKERVFEGIFPHLAEGFIEYAKAKKVFSVGDAEAAEEFLNQVFQGTLTLLYRLLFLLYAEARDLLPVKEYRGYYQKSLTRLKQEVAKAAGDISDEVPEHLAKVYRKDSTGLYDRLLALFHLADQGSKDDNLPTYNGGLFISKPDPADTSDEAGVARFLLSHKVPDYYLARGLDLLARDEDEKTFKYVFIDYKSLGVRQLGSIYEGLLEFKLRIASEKLGIVKVKGKDVYSPWRELSDSEKAKLEKSDAKKSLVVRKGDAFLENDKRERKATGSYYTPDHIVKYIVEHAVGPVLKEKFEAVTPKIRDAQKRYRQRLDNLKAMGKSLPEHELAKTYGREVVDELFDVKVLDPAMGSGHFLVEAVDFITDRLLDFLNGFPWNPVMAMLEETRRTILSSMDDLGITIDAGRLTDVNLLKRHVLKRCIYGVDLNPMAVELAKVSLWLDCFTLGAPLSFLDHHLRCGNSLIGVTVKEVQEAVEPITKVSKTSKVAASATEWKTVELKGEQFTLFGSRFAGLLLATDLMRHVGRLSDVTSAQVRESRAEYRRASGALAPFKRILDLYTSQWFGNGAEKTGRSKKGKSTDTPALDFLKARETEAFLNARDDKRLKQALKGLSPQDRRLAETTLAVSDDKRFFHWELEFPEVFYGRGEGSTQVIERLEEAGFDVVIGNPPYENAWAMTDLDDAGRAAISACTRYADFLSGHWDLYVPFMSRALEVLRRRGLHSFIVPDAMGREKYACPLRQYLVSHTIFARWSHFEGENVFDEVSRHCAIYVVSKESPSQAHEIAVDSPAGPRETAPRTRRIAQSEWLVGPARQFRPSQATTGVSGLLKHIEQQSVRVGQYCYVMVGATTHSKDRISFQKADVVTTVPKGNAKPFFDGKNLCRYEIVRDGRFLDYRRMEMYGPRVPELFASSKIVVRDVTAEDERLVIGFDTDGLYCDHLITCVTPYENVEGTGVQTEFEGYPRLTGEVPSLEYTLAVIGSSLISWYFRSVFATGTLQGSYSHTYPSQIRAFPIRHPGFGVSKRERQQQLRQMIGKYETTLDESVDRKREFGKEVLVETFDDLLAGVGKPGETLRIPLVVLHDLLGHLARQMIEMNKGKRGEIVRFLGWLERGLKISDHTKGPKGLEILTGKTILRAYLGSYQRGENEQPFDAILEVLRKNARRLGVSLNDSGLIGRLREEYEKSLAFLLPIKRRLAVTDRLIDQLVYRLYGLSEEEIRIVEGTQ